MIVKNLTLKNFRNHSYLTYDFSNGLNLLTGPNAAGKTNIVEAIHYLSLARSFRGCDDEDLIQKGKDKAEILAVINEGELNRKIRVVITKEGRKVFLNNKPITRLSELAKTVNVALFEPKDVLLFRGSPKTRREFLDVNLSKKSAPYFDYISRYEKVLKERNELLKTDKIDPVLLETTTEMLVKLSGPIVSYRQMYLKDINDILIKLTRAFTGESARVQVLYKPFVDYDENFETNAKEAFRKALESDFHRKATSIGVHREDFSIALNGRDIATFGSQGENRMMALALKLAPYFLIEDREKRPIVVLDDVMSELDQTHRQKLIMFLKKLEQVFITATRIEVSGAASYQIKKKTKEDF